MFDFKSRDEVSSELSKQGYISNKEIDFTLYNLVKLNSPLLIEGKAGVGKTEIAKVLANVFDTEMIRVQCCQLLPPKEDGSL